MTLLEIVWAPDPFAFHIGSFGVRWYGLLWLLAVVLSSLYVYWIFQREKLSDDDFSSLFVYVFAGVFIGARLGHCLFYEPDYYLAHPLDIILPGHYMADGKWHFTGYAGLASHGGAIGLIISLYLFSRKKKMPMLRVLDIISLAAPLLACIVRIANFMNSEIIGIPTGSHSGIIFANVDNLTRHPAQLYEAGFYLLVFIALWALYKWTRPRRYGLFFGLCCASIFTFRFFIEFIKERQVDFEASMPIDMGQILSLPFIIMGIWFTYRALRPSSDIKKP